MRLMILGQILESMNQVISEKGNPVVVKFAEEQVYEEARNDILERVVKQAARNLADWYGLSRSIISTWMKKS